MLIPLALAATTLATSAGCPSKAPLYQPSTTKTKAAPRRAKPQQHWRDELARYHTIDNLWNAINRHHDALGYALHPKYPTTKIIRPRPRHRLTPRPGAGLPPPTHPPPPRIDRPPVDARARAPLCRRACNHVRAICYAARRICQIARRLRDYRALLTCKRATARCADARRAARRRCRSCS